MKSAAIRADAREMWCGVLPAGSSGLCRRCPGQRRRRAAWSASRPCSAAPTPQCPRRGRATPKPSRSYGAPERKAHSTADLFLLPSAHLTPPLLPSSRPCSSTRLPTLRLSRLHPSQLSRPSHPHYAPIPLPPHPPAPPSRVLGTKPHLPPRLRLCPWPSCGPLREWPEKS